MSLTDMTAGVCLDVPDSYPTGCACVCGLDDGHEGPHRCSGCRNEWTR